MRKLEILFTAQVDDNLAEHEIKAIVIEMGSLLQVPFITPTNISIEEIKVRKIL